MTLTLELTPEEEVRLRELATSRGVGVETALRDLLAATSPRRAMNVLEALQAVREADDPAAVQAALLREQRKQTAQLFAQWAEEMLT